MKHKKVQSYTKAKIQKKEKNTSINFDKFFKYIPYIVLAFDILLIFIIRLKFLEMPFERDEGAYSYYGKLLLDGKIPYKDFYEQKLPGIFYSYAAIVLLFGATVRGMHMGFIFINVITTITIFFIGKKTFNSLCGLTAAISFSILSLTPSLSGFTVQSEHITIMFASIGIFFLFIVFKKKKLLYYFLAGLFLGMAMLTKTNGMFFVLFGGISILVYLLFQKPFKWKDFFIFPLVYSIGFFIIFAFFILLIISKGALKDMFFWSYTIPKSYISDIPFNKGVTYFIFSFKGILNNYLFFWILGLLGFVSIFILKLKLEVKIIFILLAFFSFLSIVPGYHFYSHYFIMLLPTLALFIGIFFYTIYFYASKYIDKRLVAVFSFIFFSAVVYTNLNSNNSYYFKPNFYKILRQTYGSNPFPEARVISDFIIKNSKPEDKVIVFGSEPEIYFYTKKDCPTRHAYFSAVVNNIPEHRQWQKEFIADVEKAKPRYFVCFQNPISLFVQPNTDQRIFKWSYEYIGQYYKLVGFVDMVDNFNTIYLWYNEAQNYSPKGTNTVFIFERK
ncbi:MAG: glycosyltransferase family 39 protein [Bacteroidetes bacterium]|nr:glycosyltransferase family 39 protein [Bacteroidota bacterium]